MRLLPLILIALSLGLYANTLSHEFVWDDHYFIDENSKLEDPNFIRSAFTQDLWQNTDLNMKSGFYRPVPLFATYVVFRIAGEAPWAYHLMSVLLHGANGLLVFFFLKELTGRNAVAFYSSVIFIVHPLASETVNLIANWGDLFCALFVLLCLYLYVVFLKRRFFLHYLLSLLSLFLAFLSKENAMAAIALIVLTHYFFTAENQARAASKGWLVFLPYAALTALYVGLRSAIVGPLNALTNLENVRYVSVLPSFDMLSHVLTTAKILSLYLQMFFYPAHQSISHIMLPSANIFEFETFFAVFAVIALLALAIASSTTEKRWIGFALGFFFVTILPVSNLIPISNTIAERFMYLPMLALCYLSAEMFARALDLKGARSFRFTVALLLLLVAALGLKTFKRNGAWASDHTLFAGTTDSIGCAPIAHINLVAAYNRQRQWDKAAQEQFLYEQCKSAIKEEYRRMKDLRRALFFDS